MMLVKKVSRHNDVMAFQVVVFKTFPIVRWYQKIQKFASVRYHYLIRKPRQSRILIDVFVPNVLFTISVSDE